MTPTTRVVRDYLEAAAEARRRGDLAAATCAEAAALLVLRSIQMAAQAGEAVRA